MKVIKSLLVVLAISLVCSSVSGNEKVVMPKKAEDAGFSLHITEDGVGWVFTPFINFCYTSDNYSTQKKGHFTKLSWKGNGLVLRTDDGELAVIEKIQGFLWRYSNYVNGQLEIEQELIHVGRQMAYNVSSSLRYNNRGMNIAGSTITTYEEDQKGSRAELWSEPFNLPMGLKCMLVANSRVLLVWDESGKNFSESSFIGNSESRFLAIMAGTPIVTDSGKKLSNWMYDIGSSSSGFDSINEFLNRMLVPILHRECQENGKNRFGEEELVSTTGCSSIFRHPNGMVRLGSGWRDKGYVMAYHYDMPWFVVREGSKCWQVKLNGSFYSAKVSWVLPE